MPWSGKPRLNGEKAEFGEVTGKLFPVVANQPFVIAIEGCEDIFFTLFSTKEKLEETIQKFLKKLDVPTDQLSIGRVLQSEFVDNMFDLGVRLMCDPVVIDDHHTKWIEIIRKGDEYKYVDAESN